MFESVNPPARPRGQQILTLAASVIAHVVIVAVLLVLPLLYFTDQLPEPPDMIAFVAEAAPPPPPPPPPAPAAAPRKPEPVKPNAVQQPVAQPAAAPTAAPVEAPSEITAPQPLPDVPVRELAGIEGGVAGGIAGGVAGGVMPVPPPPPPRPTQPVRIGGAIEEPRLVHRVNPDYPPVAISARKEGTVILEATVGPDGGVRAVKVLRSEPLLDKAAMEAVRQWRYAPLMLNGQAHPFILTVTVSFNLN